MFCLVFEYHFAIAGNLDGSKSGSAGIKPEQLNDDVWNYIFLHGAYPSLCGIAETTLAKMRREFEYWYPMDLRVSGKDLIGNHLMMSLYNHAAIWVYSLTIFSAVTFVH